MNRFSYLGSFRLYLEQDRNFCICIPSEEEDMNFYSSESPLPPPLPVNFSRDAVEREQDCFPAIPTCSCAVLPFRITGIVLPLFFIVKIRLK